MLNTETQQTVDLVRNEKFNTYMDLFHGNWIWRATHALIDHQDFNGSASWISQKLGVTVAEAVEALEGLEYLGLMQRTDGGWTSKEANFFQVPSHDLRVKMLKDHRIITEQVLNKMVAGNYQGYRTDFTASSEKLIKELCVEFWEKLDKFRVDSDVEKKLDGVYGITFSAVQLSQKNEGEEV